MAKVKFTAIVDGASGKLNGTVFSKNRSGAYMRSKGRFKTGTELPDKVNLEGVNQKVLFGSLATQWSGLTQYQRDAFMTQVGEWQKTDVFGDLKNPSGFNLFMRLNLNALGVLGSSESVINEPPIKIDMAGMSFWQADVANGVPADGVDPAVPNRLTLSLNPLGAFTPPAGQILVIEATAPLSPGVAYVGNNQYKKITQVTAPVPTGNLAIGNLYAQVYGVGSLNPDDAGNMPVGKRIWFRATFVSPTTGQKGVADIKTGLIQEM